MTRPTVMHDEMWHYVAEEGSHMTETRCLMVLWASPRVADEIVRELIDTKPHPKPPSEVQFLRDGVYRWTVQRALDDGPVDCMACLVAEP